MANKSFISVGDALSLAVIVERMAGEETRTALKDAIVRVWGSKTQMDEVLPVELGLLHQHAEKHAGTEAGVVLSHLHDSIMHLMRIAQVISR